MLPKVDRSALPKVVALGFSLVDPRGRGMVGIGFDTDGARYQFVEEHELDRAPSAPTTRSASTASA